MSDTSTMGPRQTDGLRRPRLTAREEAARDAWVAADRGCACRARDAVECAVEQSLAEPCACACHGSAS